MVIDFGKRHGISYDYIFMQVYHEYMYMYTHIMIYIYICMYIHVALVSIHVIYWFHIFELLC